MKEFTSFQSRLYKRNTKYTNVKECTPSQIGYDKHYFRIRYPETLVLNEITDPNYIEKRAFIIQENKYRDIISEIRNSAKTDNHISSKSYKLLIETLLTIKRRNPITKMQIVNELVKKHNTKDTFQEYKKDLIHEANLQGIELGNNVNDFIHRFIEEKAKNKEYQRDIYLTGFLNMQENTPITKIVEELFSYTPFILTANRIPKFITSDNPGYFKIANTVLSIGGLNDQFEFYFPLTPEICLLITPTNDELVKDQRRRLRFIDISDEKIEEINKNTKSVAMKHIFGNNKNQLQSV